MFVLLLNYYTADSGVQIVLRAFATVCNEVVFKCVCVLCNNHCVKHMHANTHARTCQRTRSVNVHQDYMLQPYVREYTKKCKTHRVRYAAKTVNLLLCVK